MRNHHRYKHAADEDDQVLALNNYAEGFLVKQGARVKNWKRRYFVFRDGYMSYRKDQRENSRVLGTDVVIDVFYWPGVEFGLALKLSSGRSLYVSPTSEQQACIWYEVVQGYIMRQQMIRQLQHVANARSTLSLFGRPITPLSRAPSSFVQPLALNEPAQPTESMQSQTGQGKYHPDEAPSARVHTRTIEFEAIGSFTSQDKLLLLVYYP